MTPAGRTAAALCSLASVAAAAPSVVAPALTLEQQAARADLIVRGSLGAPQATGIQGTGIQGTGTQERGPGTAADAGVPWRIYPLTITETVAGDAGRLPQVGGQPVLYVWAQAPDLPDWRTGQDAFFLLYTVRLDSPLVGYNQGYYPVLGGRVMVPSGAAGGPAPSAGSSGSTLLSVPGQAASGQPTPAQLAPAQLASAQLSVDEFRARLLRARGVRQP